MTIRKRTRSHAHNHDDTDGRSDPCDNGDDDDDYDGHNRKKLMRTVIKLVTIMKFPTAMVVATAVKGVVVVMMIHCGHEDVPGITALTRSRTNSPVESRRG